MIEKPLVSVIINCYNSEKYLRETIDSLIAQTYDNWEAIFWDNCSTDKTADIIASYKEPRFRYFIAEKNTPLGEARNLAMEKVRGEYFCFLDSDDVWLTEFLDIGIKNVVKKDNIIAFYSDYYLWKNGNKRPYTRIRESGVHSFKFLLENYGIGMSACLVDNKVREKFNIKFENKYQLIEDLDFFLKIARFGNFYYSSKVLCLYRVHEKSTTRQLSQMWANEYKELYNTLLNEYVICDCPVLKIEDLERIKQSEILWKIDNCIESNNRKELIRILLRNIKLLFEKWNLIVFIILGKNMYNKLKDIIL